MLDENEFLSPYGLRSLSRYHADHPYVIQAGGQEYRVSYLPAESDTGHVRRQLELARSHLDAGQRPDYPGVVAVLYVLRQRFHRPMSDRIRAAHEPVPGRRGDLAHGSRTSSSETRTVSVPSMAGPGSFRRIRTGATACCSTSISTATTGPASEPAIRPAGRASSRAMHLFATLTPESPSRQAGRPSSRGGSRNHHRPDQCRVPAESPQMCNRRLKRSTTLHRPLRVFTRARYSTIAGAPS